MLAFAECYVANWPAHCHTPHWIPDQLQEDEGRDRFIGHRRPLNSRENKHRAVVLALLPMTPHDLGKIRDGADYKARHQRLFLLVRGASFTRGETGDRTAHLQVGSNTRQKFFQVKNVSQDKKGGKEGREGVGERRSELASPYVFRFGEAC